MRRLSTTRTRLSSIPIKQLFDEQRRQGRACLSGKFVSNWSNLHDDCANLLQSEKGKAKRTAQFLCDATRSIKAFKDKPIKENISYYPYTDAHIIDSFVDVAKFDVDSKVLKATEGALLCMLSQDYFEHESYMHREDCYTDNYDRTVIPQRQLLLSNILQQLSKLVNDYGGDCRLLRIKPIELRVDWFVEDESYENALTYFSVFPQSRSHDEFLFLRVIHLSEFCFVALRYLVEDAMSEIDEQSYSNAETRIRQATKFVRVLHQSLVLLKSMPISHFESFRDATGRSSAVQSINYQRLDILFHGFNPQKKAFCTSIPHLSSLTKFANEDYITLRSLVLRDETILANDSLCTALRELDKDLMSWRGLHLSFAKTYLPPHATGTGSTEGAPYLKKILNWGIFDDTQPDYDLIFSAFPELREDSISMVPGIRVGLK